MKKIPPSILILAALLAWSSLCTAASFNCGKAATPSEKTICKDERLSDLDEAMAFAFASAIKDEAALEKVKTDQKTWLGTRNSCKSNAGCLQQSYVARLRELVMFTSYDHFEDGSVELFCDGKTEMAELSSATTLRASDTSFPSSDRLSRTTTISQVVMPKGGFKECVFASGRSIRVKSGITELYAQGQCGADPGSFVSVWINQAKVMSRTIVRAPCGFGILTKATFGKEGVKWCFLSSEGGADDIPLLCKFDQYDRLSSGRDLEEYPNKKRADAPVGSFVAEYAADKELCRAMAEKTPELGRIGIPDSAEPVNLYVGEGAVSAEARNEPYRYGISEFDANNDGSTDLVFSMSFETHPHDAEVQFVQRPRTPKPTSFASLLENSSLVIPYSWSNCAKHLSGNLFDRDCRITLRHVFATYMARYLHTSPFRWKGKTYVLGWSIQSDVENIQFVWLPLQSGDVEEICISRRVKDNY